MKTTLSLSTKQSTSSSICKSCKRELPLESFYMNKKTQSPDKYCIGEMGYDISIEENGRTGRKPLHWEYLDNADRKGLHDVYAGLMKLRNAHPELFDANATLTWKVGASDWDNGRTLLVKSITGKQLVVVGNFTHTATDIVFPATPGNWTNYFTGKSETVNKQVNVPAHGYVVYTNF